MTSLRLKTHIHIIRIVLIYIKILWIVSNCVLLLSQYNSFASVLFSFIPLYFTSGNLKGVLYRTLYFIERIGSFYPLIATSYIVPYKLFVNISMVRNSYWYNSNCYCFSNIMHTHTFTHTHACTHTHCTENNAYL